MQVHQQGRYQQAGDGKHHAHLHDHFGYVWHYLQGQRVPEMRKYQNTTVIYKAICVTHHDLRSETQIWHGDFLGEKIREQHHASTVSSKCGGSQKQEHGTVLNAVGDMCGATEVCQTVYSTSAQLFSGVRG